MEYTNVTRDTAKQLLEDAGLEIETLAQNDDHSFTATFKKASKPVLADEVENAHPNIVILKRDEVVEARQPNNDPQLPTLVHFAFTADPS